PQRGRDLIPLPSGGARGGFPKIGASGPKTAAKLAEYGVIADLIPDQFVGERLVEALGDVAGKRILLPRAKQGRPKIVAMLRERGARVTEIALYDTVCPAPDFETRQAIEAGVDVVTFASPSAVKGFVQSNFRLSTAPLFACIGPVTAISAENHTLPVHIMPEKYTIDALITAIVEQYQPSNLLRSSRLGGEPSLSYV
ncbi:MAG: uroporphyrinogen-III synthase, partial [Candidatus Promineifilaceae bacterium]